MKLIGSSSKRSKAPEKPHSAPAPVKKPKVKEPAVDEAYWDDMLADIIGTETAAKKPSAPTKNTAPAKKRVAETVATKPKQTPKHVATPKPQSTAKNATAYKPQHVATSKPKSHITIEAPAKLVKQEEIFGKPSAYEETPAPVRKAEAPVRKEISKKETPPKKKDPIAAELEGLFFDDGWDSVLDKPKKKKRRVEEDAFYPESADKSKKGKKKPASEEELFFPEDADKPKSKKEKKQKNNDAQPYEDKKAARKRCKAEKKKYAEAQENADELEDNEYGIAPANGGKRKKAKKKRSLARRLIRLFVTLLILAGLYLFFVFTKVPFIASLRDAYIETAMSTMSHQWMAEWFFPQSVIDEVVNRVEHATQSQDGKVSDWKKEPKKEEEDSDVINTEEDFYKAFWELDPNTMKDYLSQHPEALANGWGGIYINEAGLNDSGTSIWTKMDEQVLALDVPNRLLLVRVKGSGYQGVLAIAKDSSRLSCTPAANIGSYGERLEEIMNRTGAVLGMTGSGFIDEGGNGNGGSIVGYALCEGKELGSKVGYPYKRIELREDNLLYVVDSESEVDSKTTDAVEFAPALIVDGESLIDQLSGYTSINPRACIGQSDKGELLMLVIEGRLPSRSFGCGLPECTEILLRHNAYQAMNLDGGTSAIMWYNGEYVTKCSNTAITCRTLPNAWIYSKESQNK